MINVAIGDAAIEFEGLEYILRPSFYSVQRIGSPEEIKDVAEWCFSASQRIAAGQMLIRDELYACLHVLQSCCDLDIPHELFGYYDTDEDEWVFIEGAAPVENLVTLANLMLNNGMNGKPSAFMMRRAKTNKVKSSIFDPLEFVSSAVCHLGLSFDDAWNLTMIQLQRAIENKFPEDKKKADSMMTAAELLALKAKIKGRK